MYVIVNVCLGKVCLAIFCVKLGLAVSQGVPNSMPANAKPDIGRWSCCCRLAVALTERNVCLVVFKCLIKKNGILVTYVHRQHIRTIMLCLCVAEINDQAVGLDGSRGPFFKFFYFIFFIYMLVLLG